ncbi:MAG TPA: BON domain-containing protein, partial [Acidobacteriaceae bacterium]|nr:BON domain-containing protein [Acidobacteriaceae bacterium]
MRKTLLLPSILIALLGMSLGCSRQAAPPSDQQLTGSVQAKLQSESALTGQNIQVAVNHGVVTLSGTAADPASRALAGNDAGAVPGVTTVVNNLTVQPQIASATTPETQPQLRPDSAPPAPRKEPRHVTPPRHESPAPPPPPPAET